MIGRIAPIKKVDLCLEAVLILLKKGVQVSLTVLGPTDRKNILYLNSLKNFVLKNNLSPYVKFSDGVQIESLPDIYNSQEILVNLTETGSFDKTIIEACACGLTPLISNKSLVGSLPTICFTENDPEKLAESLQTLLRPDVQVNIKEDLKKFADENNLEKLMKKLMEELENDGK
jgi:glycosyltransferase involved in cell wall biosynthesis